MKTYLCLTILILTWQRGKSETKVKVNEGISDVGYETRNLNIQKYPVKIVNIVEGAINNYQGGKNGNKATYQSNINKDKSVDYNYDKGVFEKDHFIYDIDAGNPDIHGAIKRPCQAYDTFCIRKFFAEHSNCKISGRAVPDPLNQAQGTVYFASRNITESHINAVYRGLNDARVSEFYINEATNNLVIAVTFNNASKTITNGYYKYHLRGREPVVTTGFIGIQYGVLTVTVIIPDLNNLKLERSEIYTYGDTNIYPFALSPSIGASTDPEVLTMFASFYTNIPVDYQEEISNQGNFMVGNYIQYNICDFGLKNL